MSKVSIIIPARQELAINLGNTLQSIYENATGEFEVIVGFDGGIAEGEPEQITDGFPNLQIIKFPDVVGIKTNINAMASMATGKYIYKSDAHCRFGKGFDEILQADMEPDWIVMPRFKIIKDDWSIQMRDGEEEFYDYFFMHCPFTDPRGFRFKAGGHWPEMTQQRLTSHPTVDETPQIHGSGWMVSRDYYFNVLQGFPIKDPMGHAMEPINLALKNWLKGGKVMVNKKCWYAHLHQRGDRRGYTMSKEQENYTYLTTAEHWMGDKECNLKHDILWFVKEKFPNMPTWDNGWEEKYQLWKEQNEQIN